MNRKSESAINPRNQRPMNSVRQPASGGPSSGGSGGPVENKFAEAAYLRAGQYGFVPEDALADWFQGESGAKALPRRQ